MNTAAIEIPLSDAQMLLAWMDETFGNDSGTDWHDEDAAAVGDALNKAIEDFKRMRAALPARHAAAELVSASLVAPQELRMLTDEESDMAVCDGTQRGTVPQIIQRKFCEVNGLSIKEQAVKPATDKACKHPNAKCVYDSDDGEFERWQCPDCNARWGVEIPQ